jgi:hypothetical protein
MPREPQVRTDGVPAEKRTDHLSKSSLKRHHYANPLGRLLSLHFNVNVNVNVMAGVRLPTKAGTLRPVSSCAVSHQSFVYESSTGEPQHSTGGSERSSLPV